ncbi:MAG TPA: N-formylglutamate amidohydrolase [Steroidobacteraceae bacterium]
MAERTSILAPGEPPAARVEQHRGQSPYLLICDHASACIPQRLANLGVAAADLGRHIASDLGAAAVAVTLAARLDAVLILQNYSRLVIDCNRPPDSSDSILEVSDGIRIPGNASITPAAAAARLEQVFQPYHERIRAELDARDALKRRTILLAIHSFTPEMHGRRRPWHAGLLYHRDRRLAGALLAFWRREDKFLIGDNEPYAMSDRTDYTLPEHGERRGIAHVGIELRQDLIADAASQGAWAERLADALVYSLTALDC